MDVLPYDCVNSVTKYILNILLYTFAMIDCYNSLKQDSAKLRMDLLHRQMYAILLILPLFETKKFCIYMPKSRHYLSFIDTLIFCIQNLKIYLRISFIDLKILFIQLKQKDLRRHWKLFCFHCISCDLVGKEKLYDYQC